MVMQVGVYTVSFLASYIQPCDDRHSTIIKSIGRSEYPLCVVLLIIDDSPFRGDKWTRCLVGFNFYPLSDQLNSRKLGLISGGLRDPQHCLRHWTYV